jgi:hypothetical protein
MINSVSCSYEIEKSKIISHKTKFRRISVKIVFTCKKQKLKLEYVAYYVSNFKNKYSLLCNVKSEQKICRVGGMVFNLSRTTFLCTVREEKFKKVNNQTF